MAQGVFHRNVYPNRSLWKGTTAGIIGGLAAAWVMTQFQNGMSMASEQLSYGDEDSKASTPQPGDPQDSGGDDATMKAAEVISETVANRRLTSQEKQTAGPLVHYAFGSTMGAAFGALSEFAPRTATAWGLPFGAALWLGADELAVPALGLSKPPFDYPASTHASAFAAHLVYGLTADVVRRAVRAAL